MAGTVEVFEQVVSPIMSLSLTPEAEVIAAAGGFPVGETIKGRLIFLKFVPGWMHTLTLISAGPIGGGALEIYTNEHGGPARTWNHRLTFTPLGESSCLYTDEVEIDGGLIGRVNQPLVRAFFKFRQWRWRGLARSIA
jgi:hypothetical protein